MFEQKTIIEEDQAASLKPYGISNVPWYTSKVEALSDYRLLVEFVDGTVGIVEMRELIFGQNAGVFAALAEPEEFAKVGVGSGAVEWANGLDIAPDAMYDEFKENGSWVLR